MKRGVVELDSGAPGQVLQPFGKVVSVGHYSTIDEHGNYVYLAIYRGSDFQDDEVLGVVKPASPPLVGDRRPGRADQGDEYLARGDLSC
jgi:hypothetical protein